MERVERVGCDTLVLRTRQVGPNSWCCGVYERVDPQTGDLRADLFAFEVFGETEMESVETALHETHEPAHQLTAHR
ncbi:MAG TPA: hypothetical protein VEC38_11285 [Candidatus Binataceae bacterium]|nr:hypothetical protein [Candidatus Binataceae bacterium]